MKTNQMWKRRGIEIRPGTYVLGKWHKERYLIKRKLGSGAVGSVYLCESKGKYAALKISDQGTSMTVEVNVLKTLGKVQGNRLGPYLLDVDDWETPQGAIYSFYVMEYLQGEELSTFIKRNGEEWIGVLMLQLLEDLERLHQSGWVFGDLKLDNLLVLASPPRVRWVDVGGTTLIGRAIKEYTEFYDRGYWDLGTRKAEPSYDLFAMVMAFLAIYYPDHFQKTTHPEQTILKKINEINALKPYNYLLKKAIIGRYQTSAQMKQELVSMLYSRQKKRVGKQKDTTTGVVPMLIESGAIFLVAVGYYISSLLLP